MSQTDDTIQPISFFCAVKHDHYDYLEEILTEYNIGTYIIGAEVADGTHKDTDGEHFHFYVEMSLKDYHKFSKRVFRDKFKLRGQARNGEPRQYGKVKNIESLERMKIYTVKEGKVRSNLTAEQLQVLMDKSYEKQSDLSQIDQILLNLRNVPLQQWAIQNGKYEDVWALDEACCCRNYALLEMEIVKKQILEGAMPKSASQNKSIIKRFMFESNIEITVKTMLMIKLERTKNPWEFFG